MENSSLIKSYFNFLDSCKTERRCVSYLIEMAEKAGYRDMLKTSALHSGDKVWYSKMGKTLMLFDIGSVDISKGMNILGAHIDSPRLDIKQKPVYEKEGIVYMNTHYYGGIKKYQWVTLPLALYGVVCLKNGSKVDVAIGDNPDDPVFCVSDILPHIAQVQMSKTASEFIEGEKLDLIIGCSDIKDKEEEGKKKILSILKDRYSIEEDDFESAELEAVPAGNTRYVGFDNSLITGYGQDDRVCAFTSAMAILESQNTGRTRCCILCDKEEIGSVGATGMDSHLFDNAVAELVDRLEGSSPKGELIVRRALANSRMLSSDVNSAYDPLNSDLYDKQNSSYLSGGVVFNKYTGARGKSTASDANPEFIALMRKQMDENDVKYQTAELSKVDIGGGGTIAKYCANYGMQVLDCGVPVMSMHSPWEITSCFDVQQAYLCYKAFLELE